MDTTILQDVLRTLDVTADGDGGAELLAPGRSGAVVVPGTMADGRAVIVKVEDLSHGRNPLLARCERALYRYAESTRGSLPAPRLLDHAATSTWSALVLERLAPSPPTSAWDERVWEDLAVVLAALHRSGYAVDATPAREEEFLDLHRDRQRILLLCDAEQVRRFAQLSDVIEGVMAAAPRSVIHGDCHQENVVVADDGTLRLVDWQSVGEGHASADLAFALTRAIPVSLRIPRERAIAAYARAAGRSVVAVDREVAALQLRTLVLQFPLYLSFLTEASVRRLRDAISELTARLLLMAEAEHVDVHGQESSTRWLLRS